MEKRSKVVPKFKSEAAERAFWETHDSADFVDWSKSERVQRSHQAISRILERRKNAPEVTEAEISAAREEGRS